MSAPLAMPLIEVRDISFAYGDAPVLADVSFTVAPGEFVGLLGPNGSGKTTLLSVMLGILAPTTGSVHLCGGRVADLARKDIARRAALVPQDTAIHFAFTVRDIVAMGRTPYLGRFRPESAQDIAVVDKALAATDTQRFADRYISELSGGERQRVILARAFAQDAPVLLLDEPIANLDLVHQLETLDLVRDYVGATRCAVAALHDLSLAARYCSRLIVLADRRIVADGPPRAVLTEATLRRYFRVDARIRDDDTGLAIVPIAPVPAELPASRT